MEHEQPQPGGERVRQVDDGDEIDLIKEGGFGVLTALMDNPSTARQLSLRLGLNRARVQFLIDKSLERGMIFLYRQIHEGGHAENIYALTDRQMALNLGGDSSAQGRLAITQIVSQSLQLNVAPAPPMGEERLVALQLVQSKLPQHRAKEFIMRLQALAEEFAAAEDERAEDLYALVLGAYPVIHRD